MPDDSEWPRSCIRQVTGLSYKGITIQAILHLSLRVDSTPSTRVPPAMRTHAITACSLLAATLAAAVPIFEQVPLFEGAMHHPLNSKPVSSNGEAYVATFGSSHLSEWCASSKQQFLEDLKAGKAQDWIIVTGNEAGGASNLGPGRSRARQVGRQENIRLIMYTTCIC